MKFFPVRALCALALILALGMPSLVSASETTAALEKGLREFAAKTIESINRCVVPSEKKKEITKNHDGSYTARYIAIDPRSVNVSISKPSNMSGAVKYIGYMRYCENELSCTASTKAAAEKGPFKPTRTENLTELVKYVNGKWSY